MFFIPFFLFCGLFAAASDVNSLRTAQFDGGDSLVKRLNLAGMNVKLSCRPGDCFVFITGKRLFFTRC